MNEGKGAARHGEPGREGALRQHHPAELEEPEPRAGFGRTAACIVQVVACSGLPDESQQGWKSVDLRFPGTEPCRQHEKKCHF